MENTSTAELVGLVIATVALVRKAVPWIDGWKALVLVFGVAAAVVLGVQYAPRVVLVFVAAAGSVAAASHVASKAAPKITAPEAEVVAVEHVDTLEAGK